MSTFTLEAWAHVAGIPLATATVFTADLLEAGLAEHVGGHEYRLTPRGLKVLASLRELPLRDDEAAA